MAALAVGGVALPNDSREVVPAHTENVAWPEACVKKLREEHETCQEAQALVVAVAAPALAAVHRDWALVVAVAAIAQEVFHLEETLLASLPLVARLLGLLSTVGGACGCGVCAYGPMPIFVGGGGDDRADHDHEPCGGVRGSWAAQDLHKLLAAAALQKLTQLLARGGGAQSRTCSGSTGIGQGYAFWPTKELENV